jgi:rhodanese-related sulfurtransferase
MNLTQEEWIARFEEDDDSLILDVRTEDEFNDGIIPNAINIDFYKGQDFITELEKLDKNLNYFVYCRSGARSGKACEIMNELGFENTYNLSGGILDWGGDIVSP